MGFGFACSDVVKLANVRNLERIDDQLRKTADANRALTKQVTGATKTRDKLAEDQRRVVDRNQKEEQVSRVSEWLYINFNNLIILIASYELYNYEQYG